MIGEKSERALATLAAELEAIFFSYLKTYIISFLIIVTFFYVYSWFKFANHPFLIVFHNLLLLVALAILTLLVSGIVVLVGEKSASLQGLLFFAVVDLGPAILLLLSTGANSRIFALVFCDNFIGIGLGLLLYRRRSRSGSMLPSIRPAPPARTRTDFRKVA